MNQTGLGVSAASAVTSDPWALGTPHPHCTELAVLPLKKKMKVPCRKGPANPECLPAPAKLEKADGGKFSLRNESTDSLLYPSDLSLLICQVSA